MNLKTLKATFKRNLTIHIRAYPKDFFISSVIGSIYTALSAYFIYYLLFNGSVNASFSSFSGTSDYMSYVILGNCMYLYVVRTCLNVSRSLITEKREGTLESLMLAPFKRVQYFVGNMFEQTITTTCEMIITVLVAMPFGLSFGGINVLSAMLAFLVSLFAYFSLSLILASIMLYFNDTYISQNTLFALLFLVCGVTFPVQYLPQSLQIISKIIPVTASIDLVRNSVISGAGIMQQGKDFIEVIALSIMYCLAGFKLLKKVEIIALEKINM